MFNLFNLKKFIKFIFYNNKFIINYLVYKIIFSKKVFNL